MAELCESCRRQMRVWCPHRIASRVAQKMKEELKQEMFGPSPPFLFVGHSFYPNVYWGPLISKERVVDEPSLLYGMEIERIIEARAQVIRGMRKINVMDSERILETAQEALMSIKPVDTEVRFSKIPSFSLLFDNIASPIGATAPLERLSLAGNPAVPKKVDSLFNEGVNASEAIGELLQDGFDVHYLSKLLSGGILGSKKERRLVPTRWAITATDDIAAKKLLSSVRQFPELSCPALYSNTYLDNHFEILLLPGQWEYEQFEAVISREALEERKGLPCSGDLAPRRKLAAGISEEYEPYSGRAAYAERQGGGYYAARLAVCEALHKMKRQARAVVFREIGPGYDVPVGVWEVRENVRHAFLNPPIRFDSLREALKECEKRLAIPIEEYLSRSRILAQRRLNEF
ncbi:MAG: hypothetical protein N3G22_03410 [Candidatus Micrarchaeota archaeon]|nr:hypothetical protein [Candidatus Micrarchaeota archaeon]